MKILNFVFIMSFLTVYQIEGQNNDVQDKIHEEYISVSETNAHNIPQDNRIEKFIKQQMEDTGTMGMAVAILKNGKVLHKSSYGIANVEYSIPVSSNTNFNVASVTKLMTSTLVMRLLQEKKISLEDSVGKYIPQAIYWKNVKIKHLLAHEGGIKCSSSFGGYLRRGTASEYKVESMDDLIFELSKSPLLYTPGTKQERIYRPFGDFY